MPSYPVKTDFVARDRISPAFKRMGKGADRFGTRADKAFKKASGGATGFKSIVGGILTAGAVQKGLGAMQQGVAATAREFVSFDTAITSAAAKFPEGIERGSEKFEELGALARKVGKETRFSATAAGEGLDFLAMAGFNANQSMALLPGVTNLAVVAQTDLAGATDIASDALGSFSLMTKDTAKLTENLTRVNDVFAKTITTANVDLETLFETVKDAGPVATAAGSSIEQFSALTGVLANAGIKGTKAGTTLKNMFLKLQAPVPKAAKLLKKLGVELQDEHGNLRDIVDILDDVNKATAGMGTATKGAALNTIFGQRAIAGANILLAEGKTKLDAYTERLEGAGGASKKMADNIGKSLGARLDKLKNNLIEVGLKVFDTFKDKFPGAIDDAMAAVQGFDVTTITDGIKTGLDLINQTRDAIKTLTPFIWGAVAAWGAYKSITMAVVAIQWVRWAMAAAAVAKAASTAQWLWNAALLANPIGLTVAAVAVAVGALVALGYVIWDNWGFIWARLKEGWQVVADAFGRFVGIFTGFADAISGAFKNIFSGKAFSKEALAKRQEDAKRVPPSPPRQAPNEAREKARQYDFMRGVITVNNQTDFGVDVNQQNRQAPPPIRLELAGKNK